MPMIKPTNCSTPLLILTHSILALLEASVKVMTEFTRANADCALNKPRFK